MNPYDVYNNKIKEVSEYLKNTKNEKVLKNIRALKRIGFNECQIVSWIAYDELTAEEKRALMNAMANDTIEGLKQGFENPDEKLTEWVRNLAKTAIQRVKEVK